MQKNTWARLRPHIFLHICTKEESIIRRFDGEPHGGGASRSLAAVGGVQGFFSEYSLFLIVLFAAITVVFISIILALAVYICKAGFANGNVKKCLCTGCPSRCRTLVGLAESCMFHSSCPPALSILPISHQPKQNWADQ